MKRNTLLAGFLLILAAACTKLQDPYSEVVENFYLTGQGLNQKAFAGEYLKDSIMVKIYDQLNQSNGSGLYVEFEVISGGGTVESPYVKTDSRGMAGARWKLGNQSGEQEVRCYVNRKDGSVSFTMTFKASCFQNSAWNAITLSPDVSFTDMAGDSVSGVSLAIANSVLYKQGERFFDWEPLYGVSFGQPRRILLGNDRKFYVGTWDGRLYKSADQGQTWVECAKPWNDHSYYYYLGITSDNYLWASAYGKGLRISRDGGQSWSADTIGIGSDEILSDVYRLTDGTLYYFSLNCHLFESTDDGHTWTSIPVPGYPLKLFVNEDDELILFTQENGLSIRKSIDKGASFSIVKSVSPSFSTMMDHTVYHRGSTYYLLMPGFGILQTGDFDEFTTFWPNSGCKDMMADAHGNFLVTQLQQGTAHYYSR